MVKAGNGSSSPATLRRVFLADYRFGINQPGRWREILNTDSMRITVATPATAAWCTAMRIESMAVSTLSLTLPPLATIWLMREGMTQLYAIGEATPHGATYDGHGVNSRSFRPCGRVELCVFDSRGMSAFI
ncbi:alpha amylase C-terminal domain-containing protein [Salmonella enterica subsp. enterica]|nr:alpha amylase C-terminal domain-containing protein [Salmonella enterica subsp. enterica]